MNATTAIILDTRRKLQSGTYPVKLRVTFTVYTANGKKFQVKYYPTKYNLTAEDWEKVQRSPRSEDQKETKRELARVQERAMKIIESFEVITPDLFETNFANTGSYTNVTDYLTSYMEKLIDAGQVGTAEGYKTALSSFQKFAGRKTIMFGEITVGWLERYEAWMIENDRSYSTVGIYLRNLRAMFKLALKRRLITQDLYPFGKDLYKIPESTAFKRALTAEEKDKLLAIHETDFAVSIWVFSYFTYGMNVKDICLLKYSHIVDKVIVFKDRAKTTKTERKKTVVPIPVRPEVEAIIKRYGVKTLNPNAYIFPVLEPGLSARQIDDRIHDFTKKINKSLKATGTDLGIGPKLTTYTARHTFATVLRNKGVDTRFIQNALGHAKESTTETYFGSFEQTEHVKIVNYL